jgi:uroporphyrinogen-III synthase
MREMRVLVTRPEHDAKPTAKRLKALGHEAVIDSVLAIEPVPFEAGEEFDALAITSANAVRVLGREKLASFLARPLFAAGSQSAEAARGAGFPNVVACGGDARALAATLSDELRGGARVLYLAGEDRAQDLAALAAGEGIAVETKVVYRAVAATRLRQETLARLRAGEIGAVLHYSRRSAEIFLALVNKENLGEAARGAAHLCFSEAVATPLQSAGFNAEIAARPNEDALFALLR